MGNLTASSADSEVHAVLLAIRATKVPTLSAPDLKLFEALLKDTWPGVPLPAEASAALEAAVHEVLVERNLEHTSDQARPPLLTCTCTVLFVHFVSCSPSLLLQLAANLLLAPSLSAGEIEHVSGVTKPGSHSVFARAVPR
jgi:Hydrolytic ATP binding site of dynein motor region